MYDENLHLDNIIPYPLSDTKNSHLIQLDIKYIELDTTLIASHV